jgi:hypothetical protein
MHTTHNHFPFPFVAGRVVNARCRKCHAKYLQGKSKRHWGKEHREEDDATALEARLQAVDCVLAKFKKDDKVISQIYAINTFNQNHYHLRCTTTTMSSIDAATFHVCVQRPRSICNEDQVFDFQVWEEKKISDSDVCGKESKGDSSDETGDAVCMADHIHGNLAVVVLCSFSQSRGQRSFLAYRS